MTLVSEHCPQKLQQLLFRANAVQATGRKAHAAVTEGNSAAELHSDQLGRGILLLGNLGFSEYKSGADCIGKTLKRGQQKVIRMPCLGSGNLSKLGCQLKQQQDAPREQQATKGSSKRLH